MDKSKLPRKGTIERVKLDAFMGGVCCALSAAFYGKDAGTDTYYLEVVGSVGAEDLLAYAIREKDMELPRIRAAIRHMRRQGDLSAGEARHSHQDSLT
jgi:hypothetical protein